MRISWFHQLVVSILYWVKGVHSTLITIEIVNPTTTTTITHLISNHHHILTNTTTAIYLMIDIVISGATVLWQYLITITTITTNINTNINTNTNKNRTKPITLNRTSRI